MPYVSCTMYSTVFIQEFAPRLSMCKCVFVFHWLKHPFHILHIDVISTDHLNHYQCYKVKTKLKPDYKIMHSRHILIFCNLSPSPGRVETSPPPRQRLGQIQRQSSADSLVCTESCQEHFVHGYYYLSDGYTLTVCIRIR